MHDTALILQIGKFREYDAWVRLLTKHNGICTTFAFGASKSRRRFVGCLDNYNVVHAVIEKSLKKNLFQLKETTLLSASCLRDNWKLLGIATNAARFVEALGISEESNSFCFDLILSYMDSLKLYADRAICFPSLFKLKLASLQGYTPRFDSCVRCQTVPGNLPAVFSVADGGILCDCCSKEHRHAGYKHYITLSPQTLLFLQYFSVASFTDSLAHVLPHSIVAEYNQLVTAFISCHPGLEWRYSKYVHV